MLKNVLQIIAIFIVGACGGIFADQFLWLHQYQPGQPPVYITETKEYIIQENTALINAIEKVESAVMSVKTQTKDNNILQGSGLIITADGLAITLAELVPYVSDFHFLVDNEMRQFQILKRDTKNNLALIKIEKTALSTTGFADIQKQKLGERIFLIGLAINGQTPQKYVNQGIISAFGQDFIQTNIFEKESLNGSPLFNIKGELIGLSVINKTGKVKIIPVSKIKAFAGL